MQPFTALSPADQSRLQFLCALDVCDHLEVTDWEASFLADLIASPRPLTAAQATYIDALRAKYEHDL